MTENKQSFIYPYDNKNFHPPAPAMMISLSIPVSASLISIRSLALLDSGADITVIPQRIVEHLQLKRAGDVIASGFDGSRKYYFVYSVKITIDDFGDFVVRAISESEDYVIVGRDILNDWLLFLKGPAKIFEIAK